VLSALYLVQRYDARDILFERSCPEHRPHAALEPQEPRSGGAWTPGAPAPAARSSRVVERGVVVAESWQGQAAGAISVVGKAVLTLYSPLRPLSHDANPRDGAQDIVSHKVHPEMWPQNQL
jgi:hypothetical protein